MARDYNRVYGFANCGAQIFLPLSSKLCILIFDGVMYNIKGENMGN
jgi:hypothetical protein